MITLTPGISIDESGHVTRRGVHCGHISCISDKDWSGAEIRAAWRAWLGCDTQDVAWTGDVQREIHSAIPDLSGCLLHFSECGHYQKSNLSPERAVMLRRTVCVACSKPNWDKIAEQRASI